MTTMLPINPLILNKIESLDVPDKIKMILNEILEIEDRLEIKNEKRGAVQSISKILEKYADDNDVKEFCST